MVRKTQTFVAAALFAAGSLQAQVLTPGGTIFNPGVEHQASLGGTFVETGTVNFYSSGSLLGSVTSGVLTGDPANALGGLTFFYSISNTGSDTLSSLTIPSFSGFGSIVKETDGLGSVAPSAATRGVGAGDDVNFFFSAPFTEIGTGGGSTLLLIHTDAISYASAVGSVGGPGGSAAVGMFAPVPEPAMTTVIAGACLLTGLAVRRVRKG